MPGDLAIAHKIGDLDDQDMVVGRIEMYRLITASRVSLEDLR